MIASHRCSPALISCDFGWEALLADVAGNMQSGRFFKTVQLRCMNCGGLFEKNEYARSVGFLKCMEHDTQPLEEQSIKASASTSFARVIVCCEAGYDPDNDPYDVTTAVIEVSPQEPPVSRLYQLRIRGRFFRGQL